MEITVGKRTQRMRVFNRAAFVEWFRRVWAQRRERLWLTWVAVPLAMNAAGLEGLWWMWVPLVLVGAASSPSWRWNWVLSIQLGIVGTEWAFLGATSLGTWSSHQAVIGVCWTGAALALALAGIVNRRYLRLPESRIMM
jgi:hypothetical protein